ncbi:hypothetical protein HDU91_006100, partial [Kappamyces sp. JEL0680]
MARDQVSPPSFSSGALKEYSKRDLLRVLDLVRGRKGLVIDQTLSGPLSLLVDFSLLKACLKELTRQDHGVEKIYHLSENIIEGAGEHVKSLIYLTRPTIDHVKWIASMRPVSYALEQVKASQSLHAGGTNAVLLDHAIFFVPRRTLICDKFLEEEGIFGDVTVGEFHLDLIPFEDDVLSLEMHQTFRSLFVDGDISIIQTLSNALMKFQILYGFFPRVLGKGDYAEMLADLMERSRIEFLSNASSTSVSEARGVDQGKDSEFDSVLLLDRNVDTFTLMRTQLTYEGLMDEFFTINSSFVELESTFFSTNPSLNAAKTKKVLLNGSDAVFAAIRDQTFEVVAELLNSIALELQVEEGAHQNMSTPSELKNFAARLGAITAKKQSLSLHQKISERILSRAAHPPTNRRWKLEEAITSREQESNFFEIIDEMLAMDVPYTIPLKLLCLYSIANSGIKQKHYDQVRRDFCHAYGIQHIFTFQHLDKLGMFQPQSAASKTHFSSLTRSLKLVTEYESNTSHTDVSYVYAGYAPISLRLVQAASKPVAGSGETRTSRASASTLSWAASSDTLALLPGKAFERSVIPENKTYKSAKKHDHSPITLVVFIGGCTLAEISALRTLSQNET